ncbi:MAG: ETC complex I subunit [Rickettsiales bacterium]
MTKARIYQPDKNAMQSGKAKTHNWILEFAPEAPYFTDKLMGWTGMTDTLQEIRMNFPTKEAAIAHAERENIAYDVYEPNERHMIKKAYADNFKFKKTN